MAELRELHDRNASLARNSKGLRGRRERREARDAENDLLRVLGYADYDEFLVSNDEEAAREAPELSLVEGNEAQSPKTARQSEESQRGVVDATRRDDRSIQRRRERASETRAAKVPDNVVEELHARIAVFEEELAETRFELMKMRDGLRAQSHAQDESEVHPVAAAIRAATAGLAATAAELTSLSALMREERAGHASASAAELEAQQILGEAHRNARRERDAAHVDARRIVEQARAEAIALTRDATVTVEGLRRLANEAAVAPEQPAEG